MRKILLTAMLIIMTALLFGQGVADFYYTYDTMVDSLLTWQERYPELFKVIQIGNSQQDDLPIYAFKVSTNVQENEDKPAVLVIGTLHAEEILGTEIVMRQVRHILERPNMQPHRNWLANLELWFVPNLNPEGWLVVTDGLDITYRKNKRDNFNNGNFDYVPGMGHDIDGVDLNRNWAFNWVHGDSLLEIRPGTNEPYDYYRGPGPNSEKEVQALIRLMDEHHFIFGITWHSSRSGNFSEKVYHPFNWFDTIPSPDLEVARAISREFCLKIPKIDGSTYYESLDSSGRNGAAEDELYRRWGTIQLRAETGPSGPNNLQPTNFDRMMHVVNDCIKGQSWLFTRAMPFNDLDRSPMLTGHVTDAVTGEPIRAEVIVEERHADYLAPRLADELYGRYWRPLLAGSYTLTFRKEGYESVTLENVVVSNTGWTVRNAQLQPLERTEFSGTVLFGDSPVDATIKLITPEWQPDTLYTHVIDVVNGQFNYETWAGSRDIIVTSDNAYPYVGRIEIQPGTHQVQIVLTEKEIIFNEDWEESTEGWMVDGPWQIISPQSLDGRNAIIESFDGGRNFYAPNADVSIITETPINLADYGNNDNQVPMLSFNQHLHTVWDFHYVYVDVSTDMEEWHNLYKRSGQHDYWHKVYVSLEPVMGEEEVYLRFRLFAESPAGIDSRFVDPGWMIDEITVFSGAVQFTNVEEHTIGQIKPVVALNQNYPNPFNPETTISFTLFNKEYHDAKIAIYNIRGALVETIALDSNDVSRGSIVWNAESNASGVYLYQLILDNVPYQTRKAILMK